jgi:hypothetical protein
LKPVDVLGSEKVRRELGLLMPYFEQLEPDDKQKALVTVAWRFVGQGDTNEALKLLGSLDSVYIQNAMLEQMRQDRSFDQMVEVVSNALVEANVHVPEYMAPVPCRVAKAAEA